MTAPLVLPLARIRELISMPEAIEAVSAAFAALDAGRAVLPGVIKADWLRPGQTVIAIGSDGPDKQELEATALGRADRVIADVLAQCARLGEVHHALDSGALTKERVTELGAVVAGRAPGRTSAGALIICDLTGVGVQDAAVAALVARKAT